MFNAMIKQTPPLFHVRSGRGSMMASRSFALALLVAAVVAPSRALAGPLSPPLGPVASTQKDLAEIEPRIAINADNTPGDANSVFRISQPGSYYLTANVLGQAGKNGIEIAADNVTLDLNGFTLDGQNLAGALSGVTVEGLVLLNVVKNGLVVRWPGSGINLDGAAADPGKRIENIIARGNGSNGINGGDSCTIVDCVAIGNTGTGIIASTASTIRSCVARENGAAGIVINASGTIISSTARLNVGNGFTCGLGVSLTNCAAIQNTSDGFQLDTGSTATNCSAFDNDGNGFFVVSNGVFTGCASNANGLNGFSLNNGSLLTNSVASSNNQHGVTTTSSTLIRGNLFRSNGTTTVAANIHVSGSEGRIEDNHCVQSDYGLWIIGTRNLVVRNTSAGATTRNWEITTNNIYGPIVDRSTINTTAVSGDAANSATGTLDPNANFTN